MSSHVEQIKEKLGIVDVVSSYIQIEKAGANFKAKCPFHNEKSASFFVSPVRNSYYCFGCGAKGDILNFVQEFEGLDFVGALRVLAKRAGVELTRENPALRTERERLYLALEHATLFFQRELAQNTEALEYLKKRGLTEASIKDWRLGYSSVEWRTLITYLQSKKVSIQDMEKVGLIKKSEKSASDYYDRFRGRITFPIFDSSGRVIAFSGRQFVSDGTEAKYINSPETPLFEKSKVLYGFDRAKLNIRKQDFSLLVEGQMDLLMSHQAGFTNAVATSGTALTREQLEILRRLSNKIVIAYDGDDAGGAAARRGWQLALSLGMDISIASFQAGQDPADVVLEDPKILAEAVKNSRHIIDVELERIMARKISGRDRNVAVEKELLPYLAGLPSLALQSGFITEIGYKTGLKENLIWDILKKIPTINSTEEASAKPSTMVSEKSDRKDAVARMLMALIFWQAHSKNTALAGLDIRGKICKIVGIEAVNSLEESFSPVKDDLIFEAEVYFSHSDNIEQQIAGLALNLKEELLREEFANVMRLLQAAEREKDGVKASSLLKRCQALSLELRKLYEV